MLPLFLAEQLFYPRNNTGRLADHCFRQFLQILSGNILNFELRFLSLIQKGGIRHRLRIGGTHSFNHFRVGCRRHHPRTTEVAATQNNIRDAPVFLRGFFLIEDFVNGRCVRNALVPF